MAGFAPLSANDLNPRHGKGQIWNHPNGNCYRYCRFDNGTGNVAAAAGALVYWTNVTEEDFEVTSDITDAGGVEAGVAGVVLEALTDRYYGWVQFAGVHDAVVTDGGDDITAGALVDAHDSTDGAVNLHVSGTLTENIVGIALDADTATHVKMMLKL